MGGEITWKCQANGSFKFITKIYRDCNDITASNFITLSMTHPIGSTLMSLTSSIDISPAGDGCIPCNVSGIFPGRTEELTYESGDVFLNGVPPSQGWSFYVTDCCRNDAIDNILNVGAQGFVLRATMYSYNNQNTNPCFDSSPFFAESPQTVLCSEQNMNYIELAMDKDIDSLHYDWAPALGNISPVTPLQYVLPFTFDNPLPYQSGSTQMDHNTGEVTFYGYSPGEYVVVTKVASYKCGVKVSEIFRELPKSLVDCNVTQVIPNWTNHPPDVNAPFQNPFTGLYEWYSDTVNAGDIINFFLNATDFEFTLSAIPQTVTLNASGAQFGAGFSDPNTGCLIPPCATLTPSPPVSSPFGVGISFNWVTSCSHLEYDTVCGYLFSKLYTFNISAKDDFCPANSVKNTVVTILVNPAPPCITVGVNNPEIISYFQVLAGSEETEFHFNLTTPQNLILEMIDLYGRVIAQHNFYASPGKKNITLSNEELSSGIYIGRLMGNNFSKSEKFALIRY